MAYYPLSTEFNALYRLVSADGLSVAVFNDPLDPSYVGALTEVTGLDSAEVREAASDLTEADGGAHGAFYLGRRPITLSGRVFGHATVAERALRLDRARRASLALRADSTLSWKPSTRKENLLPNPSFENDTTGWVHASTASGMTLTQNWVRTNANAAAGAWSFRVAGSNAADSTLRNSSWTTPLGTSGFRIVAGKTYTVSATANNVDPPSAGARIRLYWYKADGSAASTAQNESAAHSAAGASRLSVTAVAPADAVYAAVRVMVFVNVANDTFDTYYDAVRLTEGTETDYIDGDTAGMFWQDTPHASASGNFIEQFTTVRRQGPFRESGQWNKDFQIPLVSEYAYIFGTGLKTVAAGVAAENRGNAPAYPLVRITGASSNPTVSDGTRTFRTTGLSGGSALAAGETVEFDMLNHSGKFIAGARNGQSANRYIDWATSGWPFLTGLGTTQTFTLTGGGTLSVVYRDAWA
jgi:hypothetical protein